MCLEGADPLDSLGSLGKRSWLHWCKSLQWLYHFCMVMHATLYLCMYL